MMCRFILDYTFKYSAQNHTELCRFVFGLLLDLRVPSMNRWQGMHESHSADIGEISLVGLLSLICDRKGDICLPHLCFFRVKINSLRLGNKWT